MRPMRAQVRQALFNVLAGDLADGLVLDLFAGSGCLGIEALSRGASRVVFVDRAPACLAAIERNLETLGLSERAEVRRHDLKLGVASLVGSQPFDLVIVHPPFELLGKGTPSQALDVAALLDSLAATPNLVTPETLVAFETPRDCYPDSDAELPTLEVLRRKDYGTTTLFVAQVRGE
jgi:16S rRNA (guanine966-N2)-methyltransferase